jgi:hypothetical protein
MIKIFYLFSWLILFSLACCNTTSESADLFFDSLVEAQVKQLSSSEAVLTITAELNEKKDQATFTPDKAHWKNELDVFRQLSSFQKPAYQLDYEIKDGINDPHSNLLIRSYRSQKEIPVPELRFYYYKNFRQLKKIEAVYQEKNVLFSTIRKLLLEFDSVSGHFEISSYRVEGTQKMIGSDSVHYLIQSRIHH